MMQALADRISRFNSLIGTAVAWLTGLMVAVTTVMVVSRYVFASGWIWMQESVIWMHALVFMLAAAYTLHCDEQVRVDVFYRGMSPRRRALVNILGTALLLIPTCVFMLVFSWDYVVVAWQIDEASPEAGGLPALYLLKTVIPLTAVLLILQGVAQILVAIPRLRGADTENQDDESAGPKGNVL